MTTAIKRRRGTTAQHATFTGLEGELTVDTTKDTVVVHDGATAGGFPLAKESQATTNVTITGGSINGTTVGASTASTGAFTSLSASGAFSANGGATLGDASGDALTINSSAVSVPNGLNFDSNTFVIDATNNRVGVGTASPAVAFDVSGNIDLRAATTEGRQIRIGYGRSGNGFSYIDFIGDATYTEYALRIIRQSAGANASSQILHRGTGDLQLKAEDASSIGFFTNGSERMRLNSSGNLGIGVTSPFADTNYQSVDIRGTTGGQLQLGTTSTRIASVGADATNGLTLNTTTATPVRIFTNGSERMRIDSSGNVGIGTSSPNAKLQVAGTMQSTVGSTTIQMFADGGSNYVQAVGAYPLELKTTGSAPMVLYTNATERMRIDASGRLLIGTTSQQGTNSQLTISSKSSTNSPVAAWIGNQYSGDTGNAVLYLSKFDNDSTTSQIFVRFTINNVATGSGQINANGASSAAFGTFSDIRLKENIETLPNQLDNILSLKPCEFDYKDGSGHQIGFIAQEMQEVYPDVVGEGSDGMLMITGWSKTEARLVKAIQEQQTLIENLTTRLNALEGK